MDISHILEDLSYDEGMLPREAIEAAIAKQKQITPYLLHILSDSVERVSEIAEDGYYQGHLYAMYLLAQFRETRALPLIIKLFSFQNEIPHLIAGDVLTEDLARILASVCNDTYQLKTLIETKHINAYVKAAAISALVLLVGIGKYPREHAMLYFEELMTYKLERKPSFAWDTLIASCCSLYPKNLFHFISLAFNENLVDSSFISLEDIKNVIKEKDIEICSYELSSSTQLINDTLEEMEKWLEIQEVN